MWLYHPLSIVLLFFHLSLFIVLSSFYYTRRSNRGYVCSNATRTYILSPTDNVPHRRRFGGWRWCLCERVRSCRIFLLFPPFFVVEFLPAHHLVVGHEIVPVLRHAHVVPFHALHHALQHLHLDPPELRLAPVVDREAVGILGVRLELDVGRPRVTGADLEFDVAYLPFDGAHDVLGVPAEEDAEVLVEAVAVGRLSEFFFVASHEPRGEVGPVEVHLRLVAEGVGPHPLALHGVHVIDGTSSEQDLLDAGRGFGVDGRAEQEFLVEARQLQPHGGEQGADAHPGQPVRHGGSEGVGGGDAGARQQDSGHRRPVFVEDGEGGGVSNGPDVFEQGFRGRLRLGQVVEHLPEDGPIHGQRKSEYRPDVPGDGVEGGVEQLLDGVPQRDARPEPEGPQGRHQRPEVDALAVPVRMPRVGRPDTLVHAHQQQGLVAAVDDAVDRLGQHRRGTRQVPRAEFRGHDGQVAAQGEADGGTRLGGGGADHRVHVGGGGDRRGTPGTRRGGRGARPHGARAAHRTRPAAPVQVRGGNTRSRSKGRQPRRTAAAGDAARIQPRPRRPVVFLHPRCGARTRRHSALPAARAVAVALAVPGPPRETRAVDPPVRRWRRQCWRGNAEAQADGGGERRHPAPGPGDGDAQGRRTDEGTVQGSPHLRSRTFAPAKFAAARKGRAAAARPSVEVRADGTDGRLVSRANLVRFR
mmetsp:Transcript_452/g.1051  ORF Transcript_452/g.1051 Transcript_452/m.1051 type:complete len:697 (-) Transcript_452:10-2100(-)